MARENIHTVYDRMAAKGFFAQNAANRDSRDKFTGESLYKGPLQFPKMLYHPQGKMRVVVPAVAEATPFGPELRNEQKELISRVVNNEEELAGLLAEGWHKHPADAIAAGGGVAPAKSSVQRVSVLEEQVARLQAELAAAKAGKIQDDSEEDDE